MSESFLARLQDSGVFPGSAIVRRFTFKMIKTRDTYTLSARANHLLVADFAGTGEKFALFHKKDRFECLSPHNLAA